MPQATKLPARDPDRGPRSDTRWLLTLLAVLIAVGYEMACGVPRYRECRTVHPGWYCAGEAFLR